MAEPGSSSSSSPFAPPLRTSDSDSSWILPHSFSEALSRDRVSEEVVYMEWKFSLNHYYFLKCVWMPLVIGKIYEKRTDGHGKWMLQNAGISDLLYVNENRLLEGDEVALWPGTAIAFGAPYFDLDLRRPNELWALSCCEAETARRGRRRVTGSSSTIRRIVPCLRLQAQNVGRSKMENLIQVVGEEASATSDEGQHALGLGSIVVVASPTNRALDDDWDSP